MMQQKQAIPWINVLQTLCDRNNNTSSLSQPQMASLILTLAKILGDQCLVVKTVGQKKIVKFTPGVQSVEQLRKKVEEHVKSEQ